MATARDFRQVLERRDVDAVVIATPRQWHAILMILACGAGKDVCVEKPLAHNMLEQRVMVETARRCAGPGSLVGLDPGAVR